MSRLFQVLPLSSSKYGQTSVDLTNPCNDGCCSDAYTVDAADSGGVQASPDTVAITPANPVEGSITIRLTLYNDNNFMADDVLYKFYWNGVSSDKLISANTVDIPAKSTFDVESEIWATLGKHKIGLRSIMQIPVTIILQRDHCYWTGRYRSNLGVSRPRNPKSGDSITISTTVSNTGSENGVK